MKKGIIIGGVLVVAAAAAIAGIQISRSKVEMEEMVPPAVETTVIEKGDIELYRSLVGTVEPSDVVYIYPKAAGEVTGVFVKAGDMVEEGQLLLTIDTKQVETARLSMEAARTALENANDTLARQQALYAAGDVAAATFESVQTQAKSARIQYEQAKLAYEYQLEFSNLTASISGRLESFDVEMHDNVSSQVLVGVISGEGSKSVTFSVPEKIVKLLQTGDTITIKKNGSEYLGTITEVSSMIDSATGLFKIKASVDESGALPTGSSVELSVIADRVYDAPTIPVDAVYYSGGNAYVYTYDDGTVHQLPVEVGIYDSARIQVISGLSDKDEVITTWSSELYEGSKVQKAGQSKALSEEAAAETAGESAAEAAGETE